MVETFDQFNVKTPSLETVDEFTIIDGKEVKVVRSSEMNDEPEPSIHHHNDLDQPGIDITSGLSGTTITSPVDNDLLAYDTASGKWINQTAIGAKVVPEGGTTTSLTLVTPTIGTMTATGGTATNLTLVTPTIGTPSLIGGTLTNSALVTSTIGTPTVTGGTATNHVLVTPTIGTPAITGGTATNLIIVTPTIGTPSLTGGTVNPIAYQVGGTVGVDGTATYVKTVDFVGSTVTYGTIVFTKGIATTVS